MLPRITITSITLGFLIAIMGALSRGYVRGRLRESGCFPQILGDNR